MKGYLLDTNVISELCKAQSKMNVGVRQWVQDAPAEQLFTSVLVLGELRQGVLRLRRRDPIQADTIQTKLDQLALYTRNALPVDMASAWRWAELNAGDPLPVIDSLLAATALTHDLVLVSRNARDFAATGVRCLDPFAA